jgi:hypothetical protein
VHRLVEALHLPGGPWLEPAAGNGAIIRAIGRTDIEWTACELREAERATLTALVPCDRVFIGDFTAPQIQNALNGTRFAVAITNPPFRGAEQFIEACLARADTVVQLLRLNLLSSQARQPFMSQHTPDVYVLPNRPSFVHGRTDHADYAWLVWDQHRRTKGTVRILSLTPEPERVIIE